VGSCVTTLRQRQGRTGYRFGLTTEIPVQAASKIAVR
jgi:hypothetical protein